MIIVNDSCIIYPYLFKRRIDIYDLHTLKLKHVIEDKSKTQEIIIGDFDNLVYYHQNIFAGKKYFYVLNNKKEVSSKNLQDGVFCVEAYEYDGNPVMRYNLDIPFMQFIIDEENDIIVGYNHQFEDYLLLYKI